MNTRMKRLDKLETLIKSKQVEKSFIVLYNEYGKVVDGVVVKMPTSNSEGVARLADGTEQAILYEHNWKHTIDIFIVNPDGDKIMFMDNEAVGNKKDIDLTGKLIIRNNTCEIIMVIPASKAIESRERDNQL